MKPIKFEQATEVLGAPQGMEKEVGGIPIYRNDEEIISCWEMDREERAEFEKTGKIYLRIMGPNTYPLAIDILNPWRGKDDGK
jgi:hypothetical protein